MWKLCLVEAEWYCHLHKSGNGGDTQSVQNEVGQEEKPAEEIMLFMSFCAAGFESVLHTFHSTWIL